LSEPETNIHKLIKARRSSQRDRESCGQFLRHRRLSPKRHPTATASTSVALSSGFALSGILLQKAITSR